MNIFGTRLKTLRKQRNIAQPELATALGVSKGVISLWENSLREPLLSNLIKLAQFFGVTIDYLAGLED